MSRENERGFNLLEMSLVMSLAAFLSLHVWPIWQLKMDDMALTSVVRDVRMLSQLAFRFHKQHGRWPAGIDQLRQNYASLSLRDQNAFGGAYTLRAMDSGLLQLQTGLRSIDQAARLRARLGPTAHRDGASVLMHFDIDSSPRWRPLAASAAEAMRGHLNIGGHGLLSLPRINTTRDGNYFLLRESFDDGSEVYIDELRARDVWVEQAILSPDRR